MGRIVHFEIPSDNPEKLKEFYNKTFDWNFQTWGEEDYHFALTGDRSGMGIDGAIMKRMDAHQPVVNTIGVDSVDSAVSRIEANGGTIVVPKQKVGEMGYVAYFKDPDGNIHGVWEVIPGGSDGSATSGNNN